MSVKALLSSCCTTRYQEAEFREKFFRLIGDEVTRIDRLTEQLLDLASPRVYSKPRMIDPPSHSQILAWNWSTPRATDEARVRHRFPISRPPPDKAYTDPASRDAGICSISASMRSRLLEIQPRGSLGEGLHLIGHGDRQSN